MKMNRMIIVGETAMGKFVLLKPCRFLLWKWYRILAWCKNEAEALEKLDELSFCPDPTGFTTKFVRHYHC